MEAIAEDTSGRDHADVVLDVFRTQLWGVEAGASLDATIAAYAVHPITRALLQAANPAKPLIRRASESAKPLPEEMFDPIVVRSLGETTAREFVTHLLTAVAHVRACGRGVRLRRQAFAGCGNAPVGARGLPHRTRGHAH